jgi:hypothetical protein
MQFQRSVVLDNLFLSGRVCLLFAAWLEDTRESYMEEERGFGGVFVGMCFCLRIGTAH